jgi:transposase-like protein
MRGEVSMARRKRRKFTDEFRAEVVELCRRGDRSIGEISRDLDLTESAVRHWVRQAEVDRGEGPPDALSTTEKEELSKLRREVRQLREEREILKKAAAFFAKENK